MSKDANGGRDGKPLGEGINTAWSVISYLLAGVGFWGLVGWLLDRWLGTGFLVAIGVLVGFAGAFYLIIRRFGSG